MSSCQICDDPDNNEMVSCDKCDVWFHFACVGESPGVENRDFLCKNCTAMKKSSREENLTVPKSGLTSSSNLVIPPFSGRNAGSNDPAKESGKGLQEETGAGIDAKVRSMERSLAQMEQKLEEERIVQEKQLEIERIVRKKKLQLEKEFQEKRLAQEQELMKEEQEWMARQLSEEQDLQRKRKEMRDEFDRERAILRKDNESGEVRSKPSIVKKSLRSGETKHRSEVFAAKSGSSTPTRHPSVSFKGLKVKHKDQSEEENDIFSSTTSGSESEEISVSGAESELTDAGSIAQSVKERGPTKAQRAARQVLSKKLPSFTGKHEEWPLFYSSFVNSTNACGFSLVENLVRLQECLSGPALESVRSRLLLPQAVPQVIETLRMLYGRPEQLVHTLLNKVRRVPPPRAERLDTFIPFGMAVQELCDHLEAAELKDHLVNPVLIQELIEKLPAATKREWVQFKRNEEQVTLCTFANFTSKIAAEASEVTVAIESRSHTVKLEEKSKAKAKGFLQMHSGVQPTATPSFPPCRSCRGEDHRIRNCERFRRLDLAERVKLMERWKLCERCLNEHDGWCKFKITCNVGNCRLRHHPLVHRSESVARPNLFSNTVQHHAHIEPKMSVIFRIAPITLFSDKKAVSTFAYLDEGSSDTLMEETLARELQVSGVLQPLTLQWTANIVRKESASQCLSLRIASHFGGECFELNDARTVKKLYLPRQQINFQQIVRQYSHLSGLWVPKQKGEEPKILVGLNNIHLLAPIEFRVGKNREPIAVKSLLGWTIYGPHFVHEPDVSGRFIGHHVGYTNQELHDLLRDHFTIEDAGVSVKVLPESDADRRAREILQATTIRVNDRFETGLLWKQDDVCFPDSYPMALSRLNGLERRLRKQPELYQKVRNQIADYLRKDYAHKATAAELAKANPDRVWYLPLSVVLHPKKPNKVRLVWDASAQVNGTSLNSMLLAGPDLLTALPAVVQHFRERAVAFSADIREMYHQLRIRAEDKHAQRFLFRETPSKEPEVLIMDVATFGSTCSPASAQHVKNFNATQHADEFPEAATAIIRRHYVDDYLDSTDTVEQAIQLAEQVRYVHSKAGFELRNWVSNSRRFLQALGAIDEDLDIPLPDSKEDKSERVLGIVWRPREDVFTFCTKLRDDLAPYLTTSKRPTKRAALSCVMCLFDPLGLLAPFTIQGKILIQDLWRSGCDWDDEMDDDCFRKWSQWRNLLPIIEEIKIPRCYLRNASSIAYNTLQLHVLVDASEQAYGGVAFFRLETSSGVQCTLVMSKTKVAPLKQLSIPRMELQAAVLGARLINTVLANHEVKVVKRVLWSDSRTVLSWIRSDQRKYKPFVAFRIGEILQETRVDEWRWVPTRANVADMLTKWGKGPCLDADGPWFSGPQFLLQSEEYWPKKDMPLPNTVEEMRTSVMFHGRVINDIFIDVTRISRWNVLLRTLCCVIRFVSNCRRKRQKKPIETVRVPTRWENMLIRSIDGNQVPLKQEEFELAEAILWKLAQRECFDDEIVTLLRNREFPKEEWRTLEKGSILHRLDPFLDEHDVLRVNGRTNAAECVPYDTRFPIILPNGHPVTGRLLEYYHQRYAHANKQTVVNEVKQRFYVPKLRPAVSRVMKQCQWCKIQRCKPHTPRMAPLPIERLTPFVKPFSYTGIDYFGPIEVTQGRRTEKRWVVLFTCLTVRAIHLEVAHRLNVDSCIMAIRRFVVRRGAPIVIFSDNGTNLKAASKELLDEIRRIDMACANTFTNARTRWSFIPPAAPHMGGVWERMVRSAKTTMTALNQERRFQDETLLTVVAEAEEIINSRPLVYVSLEAGDSEAITPNHFIRGESSGLKDAGIIPTNEAEALRGTYKRSQYVADVLWKRWLKEYLPALNLRTKWLEDCKPLAKGDLVFIVDDCTRNGWIRGRVENVFHGKDGRIRQALVRTTTGIYRRPVTRLAKIEIMDTSKSDQDAESGQVLRGGEMLATLDTNVDLALALP